MEERRSTSIRFPRSLRAWIKVQAQQNDRSISGEVITLVRGIKEKTEKKELEENGRA